MCMIASYSSSCYSKVMASLFKRISHSHPKLFLDKSFLKFPKISIRLPKFLFNFPHILRRFSAHRLGPVISLVWLSFYTIVALNLFSTYLFDKTPERLMQDALLRAPTSVTLHTQLATMYLASNRDAAIREFKLAQTHDDTPSPRVLGVATQDTDATIMAQYITAEKEIELYERLVAKYPTYSFAYTRLLDLYSKIGDVKKRDVIQDSVSSLAPVL